MTTLSYTHIARDERIQIESQLNHGNTSQKIPASQLGRSAKAIRNALKQRRYIVVCENRRNKCGRQLYCKREHLCDDCENVLCKACRHRYCNNNCSDYISVSDCKCTDHYPFVMDVEIAVTALCLSISITQIKPNLKRQKQPLSKEGRIEPKPL